MASFTRTSFRIAEVVKLQKDGKLVLQPKFQRRLVWEEKARSYLIDTIVRNFPMPKIYLRKAVLAESGLSGYEVVDGQQRLQAILDFHNGELILSKKYNEEFGDTTFSALPDPVRRTFLSYQLSTEIMEDASDPDVWAMFERLNTYTLTLNRQEKRNAKFFGYFKQSSYRLAAEQSALDAWRNLRVFGNRQIARMAEVELTSDVLVAIVDGISDITDITRLYEKYDDDFPRRKLVEETFRNSLSFIATELASAVSKTRFRNKTWFYSLLVAAADSLVGIHNGKGPGRIQASKTIQKRMFDLDAALKSEQLPPRLAPLNEALSRQTSHIPPRRIRHEHFYALLNLAEGEWNAR